MTKSDYKFLVVNDILLIVDLDLGAISVTNDIENVVADIIKQGVDLEGMCIITRDTYGVYDRLHVTKCKIVDGWEDVKVSDVIERFFDIAKDFVPRT